MEKLESIVKKNEMPSYERFAKGAMSVLLVQAGLLFGDLAYEAGQKADSMPEYVCVGLAVFGAALCAVSAGKNAYEAITKKDVGNK